MAVIAQFTHFALHSHTTTPVGNITPTAIGDLCINSTDAGIWIASGTTAASWTVLTSTYGVNLLVPTFTVVTDHEGGNADFGFTLPARTNGWRLIDAYVRSTDGTGGNLTLKDAAAGNAMTDAIVPGNANIITRAAQIIVGEQVAASASTPVWDGAAGTPATTCYSVWIGL